MTRFVLHVLLFGLCLSPVLAQGQSLVINELMYDSATHGTNEEWIELHNAGTTTVNLIGWRFTKGIDFTFTSHLPVPPGGYVVVAANPAWFATAYPGVDGDFVVGNWAGTLANGGEALRLEDPNGNEVDEISYADEGDWATRIRGPLRFNHRGWDWFASHKSTGRSVELVNPMLPNESGQNWATSVPDGGTPGAANSVLNLSGRALIVDTTHLPLVPRSTNAITIASQIFAPTGQTVTVRLFYRVDANPQSNPFTAVSMNDNGADGDVVAGDGIFAAVVPPRPNGTVIEFYVETVTSAGVSNSWPALSSIDGVLARAANALLQVDDSVYAGSQPIYRLIMTEAERVELNTIINNDDNSDAQMNGTLISLDGSSSEVRYQVGIRIRGAGSRGVNPSNLRVNIPDDRRWKDVTQINLNTQFTHAQLAGYALATRSGLAAEAARAVQVRINGANLALANSPQFGSYAATEAINGDFVDAHFPDDNDGNVYRASTGSHSATLAYLGQNAASYMSAGYSKQNNTAENDWSDLIGLTFALSPNTPNSNYVEAVRERVNVEEWMLYFALYTMTLSGETAFGTGFGDDFALYRGVKDPRFLLLPHDWDTIMGQGSGANFSTGTNLFRAAAIASVNRFLRHPEFVPVYYATLKRLVETTFSEAQASRTLDEVLGSWVPAPTISAMKTFVTNRNAYIRSQIPLRTTVLSSLPLASGFRQSSSSIVALGGASDAINTRTVLVNGSTSVWSAWEARWTNTAVVLNPGINRVLVQSLGTNGFEIGRTNIDIWYNVPGTPVAGSITENTSWTADNAPYTVTGTLSIAPGSTLTIEPGVSVYFASGANISVMNGGRLLAEGTDVAGIRFTRVPGTSASWGSIVINGAPGSIESRISHAHIEFNNGTAISVQGGAAFLHRLTFGTTTRRYLDLDGASFLVSECHFPATTASIEPIHGTGGIRSDGHGVFVRNYFGRVIGYNDAVDFSGGNRPGPIVHFINNVFAGTDDDHLDLDSTDAWIEGNIFLHAHRNGSPDSASAISGGNDDGQTSEITVVGNIFYDVDHAAMAKQGDFYTFINNTVVRQSSAGFQDAGAGAVLNFADPGTLLAAGMYAEANIIWDAERLTRNLTNGTPLANNTTFNNNLMPFPWTGPGTNNSPANPHLTYVPDLAETTNFTTWESAQVLRSWFVPRAGSPAVGAGPNGRDIGGVIPLGVSIAGVPAEVTATNGATLLVGFNRSAPNWPSGSGFTHYKWRLNNGVWSSEAAIGTSIVLSGLSNGVYTVEVSGRRDSGLYQDDPLFALDALPTASRTWRVTNSIPGRVVINEVLARNAGALVHEGLTPDSIELFNPGSVSFDLSGKGITDDPSNKYQFMFPSNTVIGPGQYLVVYADTAKEVPGIHLGFALNDLGGALFVYDTFANGGGLLDSLSFGLQLENLTIGRLGDGGWALTRPTFGAPNEAHPVAEYSNLRLNEWLADQTFGNDFLEVVNTSALPAPIGGAYLSDTPSGSPFRHQVPFLSFLPANGYFPFVADGDAELGADHLNFKLSAAQGALSLTGPDGTLIDIVIYGPQTVDVAEGRSPNGTGGQRAFEQPTPGAPNPFVATQVDVTNFVANIFGVTNRFWRYNDSGTDFGTAWRAPQFDDSGWPTGRGLFGFETSPGLYPYPFNTFSPSPANGGPLTVYYRVHFQWTNGPGWQLLATNLIDDGAVFYINGQEAGRLRITANPVVFSSQAQNQPNGNEGIPETISLSTAALVNGDNVLAVEVHQGDSGSSDAVFGMALTGLLSVTNTTLRTVVLNEVMANNVSYTNTDGTITDWVELYNPSAEAVDLTDMSLSDNVAIPRRWVFPAGVSVPASGYLIVKFDSSAPASTNAGPHMNTGFGFSAGGDRVLLFDAVARGGALLDSVQFGLQAADFTIGRVPNANGSWTLTLPTESSVNIVAALGNPSELRVNEWLADPPSGEDDYFELYNPNPQPVALGGLYLTDDPNNRTQYRIPNLSFVGVGVHGFALFLADNNPQNGADHVNFRLSGNGESISVVAGDGLTVIDRINFGAQQQNVSEGRFPDGSAGAFQRFPETPSPAQSNFLPFDDITINEALTHSDPPLEDAIELFNPTASPIDISGWYLSDSQLQPRKFRIPSGTIIQAGGFVVFYEYQFNPTAEFPSFSLSSAEGDEIFLSVTDTNGNLTGYRAAVDFGPQVNGVTFGQFETSIGFDFVSMTARTLGVDAPASVEQFRLGQGRTNAYPLVGPIVISEIQYHPPNLGTNDNLRDEFVELHNSSGAPVALFDPMNPTNTWRLRDAVDFDFPAGVVIPAGGYLLVVGFDPATNATDLANFRAAYGISPAVPILGPFVGVLSNGDDEIELRKPDAPEPTGVPYVLVERVHYRDELPWPSAADGNGVGTGLSLQRVAVANYANDPVNWVAAVPTPGAASGPAVITPPSITAQPTNRMVLPGTAVLFTVNAAGAAPLYYQWRFNGLDIPNATNATYLVANAQAANAGGYSVRVMNAAGVALSATARLALQVAPQIVFQPRSANVAAGASATFTVGARGSEPLTYQWWKDASPLIGATQSTLSIPNVQAPVLGNYFVVISNSFGSATSAVASLQLSFPPQIVSQPTSQNVIIGQTASFAVGVSGSTPLSFQWYFNGSALPGATSSNLVFTNVQPARAGTYSVLVSNAVGNIVSDSATLVVVIPPTVTIAATDATAAEAGLDPALFTITRSGATDLSLVVHFNLSGTAQSGADYPNQPSQITIRPGTNAVTFSIVPIDDAAIETTETVNLTLVPSLEYLIESPGSATATIADNDNLPPMVTVTTPTNGTFAPFTPTNLLLAAVANDPNGGQSVRVDFYFGTNKVGEALAPPYQAIWSNAPAGSNLLTAVATDALGVSGTSAPVALSINGPPLVSVVNPTNGSVIPVTAQLPITASATDTNGGVARVDIYVNGALLGAATDFPYTAVMTNGGLGVYQAYAVARDVYGLVSTSAVATFTVTVASTNLADMFANRGVLAGYTNFITGNNNAATVENGEPNHYFSHAVKTMWLQWTAPASGAVIMETVGSAFDTILAVYTNSPGAALGFSSLVQLAVNDDSVGLQSRVSFGAEAGTVYYIAVAGYDTSAPNGGNVQFRLGLAAPPFIVTQPISRTVDIGDNVVFSVVAVSSTQASYQWRLNGTNILGALSPTLSRPNIQLSQAGEYDVRVANIYGAVTSAVAVLVVRTPIVPSSILSPSLSNGVFTATLAGGSNRIYVIEWTSTLTNWTDLVTVSNGSGRVTFTDTNAPASPGALRAYRARLLP